MSSRSSRAPSRAKRNQQIFSVVLSIIVVMSMALSLIVALSPSSVQPPVATTSAPVFVTPQSSLVLPTATPSPTPTPVAE